MLGGQKVCSIMRSVGALEPSGPAYAYGLVSYALTSVDIR